MAEEKFCRKYIIRKTDGSDIPPENRYFVLRYDAAAKHGKLNRSVLINWCLKADAYEELGQLSDDLLDDIYDEAGKIDE